jgi:LysM repeat protein
LVAGAPRKVTTTRALAAPVSFDADEQALLAQVTDYYHARLKDNEPALAYLNARGLTHPALIDTFKPGVGDRTLGLRLPLGNRLEGAAIRTRLQGLGVMRESGHEHFNGCLVVPVLGEDSQVTEVYGRKLREDTFTYDDAGNRTRVQTHEINYNIATGADFAANDTDRYYEYDAMNRQTLVDGDASGNIGAVGHQLAYDKAGNRISDKFVGTKVTPNSSPTYNYDPDTGELGYLVTPSGFTATQGLVEEDYRYDGAGRLLSIERDGMQIDWRLYDAAGRAVQTGSNGQIDPAYYSLLGGAASGNIIRSQYDANGQLTMQQQLSSNGTKQQYTLYEKADGTSGYDAAGNLTDYKVGLNPTGETITYHNALGQREGYLQTTTTATSSKTGTGTSTTTYDANGALTQFTDQLKSANNKSFVTNEAGQVIATEQTDAASGGKTTLRQMTVNGEVLGQYGGTLGNADRVSYYGSAYYVATGQPATSSANVADFAFGYRSITPTYPAASPGTYVVRQGDSLRLIAQTAYGDANLWYRIAEANSLRADADLRVGQTLNLPNVVAGAHNDAGTFQAYDPSKILGDTNPTLPQPQGHHGGCGGAGQVLAVVVAVVATVFTAGAAALAMGAVEGTTLAGASLGTIMSTGASAALGGVSVGGIAAVDAGVGASVGAAAIGGAVGSVASQLSLVATNDQHGFNWKQVGLSALGAGATAGLGAVGVVGGVAQATDSARLGMAVRAALANVATQGIGVATGLQSSFSWQSVTASAVGAGVGQAVGSAMDLNDPSFASRSFGEQFGDRLVTGLAAGATAAVMRGGKVAIQQVAVDAFGNALGQRLVDQANSNDRPSYLAAGIPTSDEPIAGGAAFRYDTASAGAKRLGDATFNALTQIMGAPRYGDEPYMMGTNAQGGEVWSTGAETFPVSMPGASEIKSLPPIAAVSSAPNVYPDYDLGTKDGMRMFLDDVSWKRRAGENVSPDELGTAKTILSAYYGLDGSLNKTLGAWDNLTGAQASDRFSARIALTVDQGQVTFDSEGNDNPKSPFFSRQLHWPGGASGVTIGRGYDIGGRSSETVLQDLTASGVDSATAEKIAAGAGLSGADAKKFVSDNRSQVGYITRESQKQLFERIYPDYVDAAKSSYEGHVADLPNATSWEDLQPRVRDVAVDFAYQQGRIWKSQALQIMNNDPNALADYISTTPKLSQYELGRNRAPYLRH